LLTDEVSFKVNCHITHRFPSLFVLVPFLLLLSFGIVELSSSLVGHDSF